MHIPPHEWREAHGRIQTAEGWRQSRGTTGVLLAGASEAGARQEPATTGKASITTVCKRGKHLFNAGQQQNRSRSGTLELVPMATPRPPCSCSSNSPTKPSLQQTQTGFNRARCRCGPDTRAAACAACRASTRHRLLEPCSPCSATRSTAGHRNIACTAATRRPCPMRMLPSTRILAVRPHVLPDRQKASPKFRTLKPAAASPHVGARRPSPAMKPVPAALRAISPTAAPQRSVTTLENPYASQKWKKPDSAETPIEGITPRGGRYQIALSPPVSPPNRRILGQHGQGQRADTDDEEGMGEDCGARRKSLRWPGWIGTLPTAEEAADFGCVVGVG